MKSYLLDSYALISYLNAERGHESVSEILSQSQQSDRAVRLCIVNYGEVLYHALRTGGKEKERETDELIKILPLDIINIDIALTRQAAYFKAFYKISYADAFAASTAKLFNLTLVTGDKEFKSIEKEIKIEWI